MLLYNLEEMLAVLFINMEEAIGRSSGGFTMIVQIRLVRKTVTYSLVPAKLFSDPGSSTCQSLFLYRYVKPFLKGLSLVKKYARDCGSAEKCQFTQCFVIFSALRCVAPIFSALKASIPSEKTCT